MLKILFIEDELIIAKDIAVSLEKNNYARVDHAKNHETAFRLFEKNDYDILISDINLNDFKDGIEIISELSKIKKIPVVYLTAYSDYDIVARAEKTIPFAYLLKPYNEIQLKATLNLALLNFRKISQSIQENEENTAKLELLTAREKELLVTLSTGKLSKEIAETLKISVFTVEQHKKNIKKKLGLNTVGELVNFALSVKQLAVS
jgi:DNA-binding NarL/FixJ family response regulator